MPRFNYTHETHARSLFVHHETIAPVGRASPEPPTLLIREVTLLYNTTVDYIGGAHTPLHPAEIESASFIKLDATRFFSSFRPSSPRGGRRFRVAICITRGAPAAAGDRSVGPIYQTAASGRQRHGSSTRHHHSISVRLRPSSICRARNSPTVPLRSISAAIRGTHGRANGNYECCIHLFRRPYLCRTFFNQGIGTRLRFFCERY